MKDSKARTASIIFRLTPEEKQEIEQAALVDHRSPSDFARVAVLERARAEVSK